MNLEPNTFARELPDMLATTGKNYTIETVNLGEYGASYEITEHDSPRKLHLTPVEDDMIDVLLSDENGNTLASGTMFSETVKDLTSKELATLVTICL